MCAVPVFLFCILTAYSGCISFQTWNERSHQPRSLNFCLLFSEYNPAFIRNTWLQTPKFWFPKVLSEILRTACLLFIRIFIRVWVDIFLLRFRRFLYAAVRPAQNQCNQKGMQKPEHKGNCDQPYRPSGCKMQDDQNRYQHQPVGSEQHIYQDAKDQAVSLCSFHAPSN